MCVDKNLFPGGKVSIFEKNQINCWKKIKLIICKKFYQFQFYQSFVCKNSNKFSEKNPNNFFTNKTIFGKVFNSYISKWPKVMKT